MSYMRNGFPRRPILRAVRAGTIAGAGTAAVIGLAAAGTGVAAADADNMTPIPGAAHEYQVHGIMSIDDVMQTDKDLILGGGDVRATSTDGVNFHYYRMVAGARLAMARSPEVCVPTIPCHAVVFDDNSPIY